MEGLILALIGLGFCLAERHNLLELAEDLAQEEAEFLERWGEPLNDR